MFMWMALVMACSSAPKVSSPPLDGRVDSADRHRKLSSVLDQIDETPYPELPVGRIEYMRSLYRSTARPSADQLSALVFKLDSGIAPYADFAVFGPYGRRQAKLMRSAAQVFGDGQLVTR